MRRKEKKTNRKAARLAYQIARILKCKMDGKSKSEGDDAMQGPDSVESEAKPDDPFRRQSVYRNT